MAKKEVEKVGTNPLKLPFPNDPQGFLLDLKKGGVRAVQRTKGNQDRLDKFMDTLRILAAYAKEKFDADQELRARSRNNAASSRARHQQRVADAAKEKLAKLAAQAAVLEAQIKANTPDANEVGE